MLTVWLNFETISTGFKNENFEEYSEPVVHIQRKQDLQKLSRSLENENFHIEQLHLTKNLGPLDQINALNMVKNLKNLTLEIFGNMNEEYCSILSEPIVLGETEILSMHGELQTNCGWLMNFPKLQHLYISNANLDKNSCAIMKNFLIRHIGTLETTVIADCRFLFNECEEMLQMIKLQGKREIIMYDMQ